MVPVVVMLGVVLLESLSLVSRSCVVVNLAA